MNLPLCARRWIQYRPMALLLGVTAVIASFAIWAAPVLAAEAEGEGAGWGILDTVGRFVNLFILGGILVYFVRKPLLEFFETRRSEFSRQMVESDERRREAESRIQEVERRMNSLDQEIASIRTQSDTEMEEEARRLEQLARQESEKILSTASREIDGMVKAAQKELRRYAGTLSIGMAEETLRREVGPADQERIVKTLVSQIGEKK